MTNKPETKVTPSPNKETPISKADELVKGSDFELDEEELKRITGGALKDDTRLKLDPSEL
jgi:hypothetical protein